MDDDEDDNGNHVAAAAPAAGMHPVYGVDDENGSVIMKDHTHL